MREMSGTKVCVAVRVRPLIERENNSDAVVNWRVENNVIQQIDFESLQRSASTTSYTFDHVFVNGTREVYDAVVAPIVNQAFNGFNGTVLCYGQTSSGKTYTLYGNENEAGIISLLSQDLFRRISDDQSRTYIIRVGLVEIYNEKVTDLLHEKRKEIQIVEINGAVVPKDLEEIQILKPEDMLNAAQRIQRERKIGETQMNKESSRSHTILRIFIESVPRIPDADEGEDVHVMNALLNFVDLAGSEKAGQTGAQGDRFKEATYINKSLTALTTVVKQLSEDINTGSTPAGNHLAPSRLNPTGTGNSKKIITRFVNYRDSKLTRILQSSLSGNAFIAMICNVTPASTDETHSTLRFARTAKAIAIEPKVNRVLASNSEYQQKIKELQNLLYGKSSEVEGLKRQLGVYMKLCQNNTVDNPIKPILPNSAFTDRRKTICASVFLANRDESSKTSAGSLSHIPELSISTKRKADDPGRASLGTCNQSEQFMTSDEAMKHFELISEGMRHDSWSDVDDGGILSKEELKSLKFDAQVQTEPLTPEPSKPPPPKKSKLEDVGTPKTTLRLAHGLAAAGFEQDREKWKADKKVLKAEVATLKSQAAHWKDEKQVLENDLTEMKSQLEAYAKKEAQHLMKIKELEVSAKNMDLIDEITAIEFKNQRLERRNLEMEARILDLETKEKEFDQLLADMNILRVDLKSHLTDLQTSLNNETRDVETMTTFDTDPVVSTKVSTDATTTMGTPITVADASSGTERATYQDVATGGAVAALVDANTNTTHIVMMDATTGTVSEPEKTTANSETNTPILTYADASTTGAPIPTYADASTMGAPIILADATTGTERVTFRDVATGSIITSLVDANTSTTRIVMTDAGTDAVAEAELTGNTGPVRVVKVNRMAQTNPDFEELEKKVQQLRVTRANLDQDVATGGAVAALVDANTNTTHIVMMDATTGTVSEPEKTTANSETNTPILTYADASTTGAPIPTYADASTMGAPIILADATTGTERVTFRDVATGSIITSLVDANTSTTRIVMTDAGTDAVAEAELTGNTGPVRVVKVNRMAQTNPDFEELEKKVQQLRVTRANLDQDVATGGAVAALVDGNTNTTHIVMMDATTGTVSQPEKTTANSETNTPILTYADASTTGAPIPTYADASTMGAPIILADATTGTERVTFRDVATGSIITSLVDANTSTTRIVMTDAGTDAVAEAELTGNTGPVRVVKVNRMAQTNPDFEELEKKVQQLRVTRANLDQELRTEGKKHKAELAKERSNVQEVSNNLKQKEMLVEELKRRINSVREEYMAKKPTNIAETQCDFMEELVRRSMKGERGLLPAGYPELGNICAENKQLKEKMYMTAMEKGKAEREAQERLGKSPLNSMENIQMNMNGSQEKLKFSKPAILGRGPLPPAKFPVMAMAKKKSQATPPVLTSHLQASLVSSSGVNLMLSKSVPFVDLTDDDVKPYSSTVSSNSAMNGSSRKPTTATPAPAIKIAQPVPVPKPIETKPIVPAAPQSKMDWYDDEDGEEDIDDDAYALQLEQLMAQGMKAKK